MHYVIIGNGVAGMNAANTVRNRDEDCRITIVSYESEHFFSRTALMYVACGQLSERCVEPYERDHYQRMNFTRVRDRAVRLDSARKTLELENGNPLTYDRLLIASGSVPMMLDWPGIEFDGVGNFVTWQNMDWLREKAGTARRAVVVGGGLIGIETVEILLMAGIKVTFLIREDFYWPIALDERESAVVMDHMKHHGVELRLKTEFKEVVGENGKVVGIVTGQGDRLDCDTVVFTIGVRPQTDWLKDSNIELDERGGIVVDNHLQTSVPDVWAAGDCTSVVWFNGVRRPEQLWYTSRDQGKIAGNNMLGHSEIYRRGIFYNSAKFFDIEYTTAGLVNFGLEGEQNWYMREANTNNTLRIVYLPDGSVVGFNMLGRRWDHRVLVKWIHDRKKLDWVLRHINRALFDEEFMPRFKLVPGASSREVS
ncbi:MAG: FAD-dependent oxidoreductase [Candidatus Zixiibacteriota bacterium]|nr:MAG: FAD-dependent oxidoreductase [candidate division Zixibacteria bacterium]